MQRTFVEFPNKISVLDIDPFQTIEFISSKQYLVYCTAMEGDSLIHLRHRSVITLFLFFSLLLFTIPQITQQTDKYVSDRQIQNVHFKASLESSYFSAFSDYELASLATTEGWDGDGSETHPFMIKNLVVTFENACINFQNISSYFIFENCTLATTSNTDPVCLFMNVTHGQIINSSLIATELALIYECIIFERSPGFNLENCTIHGPFDIPFYTPQGNTVKLSSSPGCNISNCHLVNCYLKIEGNSLDSFSHSISDVLINDRPLLYLNSVSDFELDSTEYNQVLVIDCQYIRIRNNIINSSFPLLQIYYSEDCFLENNTFFYMGGQSVMLAYCDSCELWENTFDSWLVCDIILNWCKDCRVIGNHFHESFSGIYVSDSEGCEVSFNTMIDCHGISCNNISSSIFTGNFIEYSGNGICLYDSQDCYLNYNQAYSCGYTMYCSDSRNITYFGDTYAGAMSFPARACYVRDSIDIWIESSSIGPGSEGAGLYAYNLSGFTFISNVFPGPWTGLTLYNCDDGLIHNNTFFGELRIESSTLIITDNNAYLDSNLGVFDSNNIAVLNSDFPLSPLSIYRCHHCQIENVTLIGVDDDYWPIKGLSITDSYIVTVTNLFLNHSISFVNPHEAGYGVWCKDSRQIELMASTIVNTLLDGVFLVNTNISIIENCLISDNPGNGITLTNSSHNLVVNNQIKINQQIGLLINSGINNSIYGNQFCNNSASNAFDDGALNRFDDTISQGNLWSDYSGSGFYYIEGSAGSVDHFPWGSQPNTTSTSTTATTTQSSITTPTSTATNTTTADHPINMALLVIDAASLTVIVLVTGLILRRKQQD